MKKSHIYVIYTGGTIGMKKTEHGFAPVSGYLSEHIAKTSEFHHDDMPDFTLYEYNPLIDSSNATPEHWNSIAQHIQEQYETYDGFVILHGTDTMAYTASALSFIFENLSKPIIITGSQIPLSQLRSDGQTNFLNALYIAANHPINEVCLFFNNKLFRGNRTTKICADSFDAFSSPNYPILVESGIQIKHLNKAKTQKQKNTMVVHSISEQPIQILTIYPGIPLSLIQSALQQPTKALILMTYGSGNAPQDEAFIKELAKANEQEIIIINLSQCLQGRVNMDNYATGRSLLDAGVISGHDMTLESALTKLYFVLSLHTSHQEKVDLLTQSIRGELSQTNH